jgi:hypothetical protein
MTDEEFKELLDHLFKMGLDSGDLGYEYWSGIIKKLKEMRKLAQQNEHHDQ